MNIKDFLIENYIWILVIILITIVTIIGFLADKNKGKKKESKNQQPTPTNSNLQPINNQEQMQYHQSEQVNMGINQTNTPIESNYNNNATNNMQMNYNNVNSTGVQLPQMNNPVNNDGQNINTIPQPTNSMTNMTETVNNPQPVETIQKNVEIEPMYQPLSEQTPHIAPQPIPNILNMQNPLPTGLNHNQTSMQSMTPNQSIPMETKQNNTQMPIQDNLVKPIINQQQTNIPSYNMQQPVQPMNMNNPGINQNIMQNNPNTTIPQPVIPQSILPQQTNQNFYNQQPMPQQNIQQQIPQQMPNTPVQQQSTTPAPVNFVFGPQNNNQNM